MVFFHTRYLTLRNGCRLNRSSGTYQRRFLDRPAEVRNFRQSGKSIFSVLESQHRVESVTLHFLLPPLGSPGESAHSTFRRTGSTWRRSAPCPRAPRASAAAVAARWSTSSSRSGPGTARRKDRCARPKCPPRTDRSIAVTTLLPLPLYPFRFVHVAQAELSIPGEAEVTSSERPRGMSFRCRAAP
jgi:hypothetical protein